MAAPRSIDTPQTTPVVLTANDSNLTINATIAIATGTAVELSAGFGGTVTLSSVITAPSGIRNTGNNPYAVTVNAGGQVSDIFFQTGIGKITNAGRIEHGVTIQGNGNHEITNSNYLGGSGSAPAASFRRATTRSPTRWAERSRTPSTQPSECWGQAPSRWKTTER